jgi:hypothetical protein
LPREARSEIKLSGGVRRLFFPLPEGKEDGSLRLDVLLSSAMRTVRSALSCCGHDPEDSGKILKTGGAVLDLLNVPRAARVRGGREGGRGRRGSHGGVPLFGRKTLER